MIFERAEVEAHFARWREAVDRRDIDAMASMLAADARGGNAQFGLLEGREAVVGFMRERWPETVPNRSVWHAIDGERVVNKWRETLPGQAPSGEPYDYDGISEFIYTRARAGENGVESADEGKWSFMYGLPDVIGLSRVHARWLADGQAEIFGEVYPGLG